MTLAETRPGSSLGVVRPVRTAMAGRMVPTEKLPSMVIVSTPGWVIRLAVPDSALPGGMSCTWLVQIATSLDVNGVSTLVLVSAGYAEDDQVIARHRSLIDAAVRDGVVHVIYTSLTGTGDHLGFALAHRATEDLVKDGGLAWTILRNGLYAELFGALLAWTPNGLESAFGDGALSAVARPDLAAAIIASRPTAHAGQTYDLVGEPITAEGIAERLGVSHRTIGLGEYRARLLADVTLLPFQPPMLTSIASSVRHGFLSNTSPDLVQLLDRPITDALTVAADTAAAMRPSGC